MSIPPVCQHCGKPVGLGDLLLPTGPVCKACDTLEKNPPQVDAAEPGRPTEFETRDSQGLAIPDFVLVRGARGVALEIEEWLHVQAPGGAWNLAASWNERYPGRLATTGPRCVSFTVVLSWTGTTGKPFRDIGPLCFVHWPTNHPEIARAVALTTARDWARRQARLLGLPAPSGFLPARTDFPGGV